MGHFNGCLDGACHAHTGAPLERLILSLSLSLSRTYNQLKIKRVRGRATRSLTHMQRIAVIHAMSHIYSLTLDVLKFFLGGRAGKKGSTKPIFFGA